MSKQINGTAVRGSFICEFAYGDKSEAIKNLIQAAKASHRFDGIENDAFIYEGISPKRATATRKPSCNARIQAAV